MSFSRCRSICVLLVGVIFCLRMMDTIVLFSVWASNTLKMHSWIIHAPVVGIWAWIHCDFAFPFWKDWHALPLPVQVSLAQAEDRRMALWEIWGSQRTSGSRVISLVRPTGWPIFNCLRCLKIGGRSQHRGMGLLPLRMKVHSQHHKQELTAMLARAAVRREWTTSAPVALPSPGMDMAPRYSLGEHHSGVSPLLQPLDRHWFSKGRGALRTSVPA